MALTRKTKRPLAMWTKTYPKQHQALRPENTAAGGVKSRSQPEAVRMEIYKAIKALFLTQNPMCDCCQKIYTHLTGGVVCRVQFADSVHHHKGRSGLLLFDVRHWLAACDTCHRWIHDHPAEAQKLGLLSKEWNKQG